ncbi:transcriptional regulator with XRE-family HTH domain [Azospirillum fermentarium]|uniref:hypothetical protein n=1 Tax=Azospirillum fermentarium TaxID=1233114 RepID=UPI002226751B|nr:hypothetical protein [Azospirillum fermentarium]MCW2248510.1 transcriptional regulator with XRE-family HTH domain [Azospirillum fermentarium]
MTKPLSERITDRLAEIGLTPNGASILAGKHRDFIRNIQRGMVKIPRGDNLLKLAEVLQVPPSFFADGFDTPLPKPAPHPSGMEDWKLKAIADLDELPPSQKESFLEELRALADAARARKKRAG